METKHTPGPWNLHPAYVDEQPLQCVSVGVELTFQHIPVAQGEKFIAVAHYQTPAPGFPHVADLEEAKANARLIAAAPELLEALNDLVESAEVGTAAILNPLVEKARAAVAKATGG